MSIQRAVVIGAGSGVGKATASALRAAGVDVLASGRERDATDPALTVGSTHLSVWIPAVLGALGAALIVALLTDLVRSRG